MPRRKEFLATGEIYHVFNRGIDRRPLFTSKTDYRKLIECWWFYRYQRQPTRLSHLNRLKPRQKTEVINVIVDLPKQVDILAYCLMDNHFHLLLRQKIDVGIQKFMADSINSYTRWFNVGHQRSGNLLSRQFKAVRIETDEQFWHVSRYIHLNPYTGFIIKTIDELDNYVWSSFQSYSNAQDNKLIEINQVDKLIQVGPSYRDFVYDQANYQRQLDKIKHLTLDNNDFPSI